MVTCSECKTDFSDDVQLHRHLKTHKLRIAEYYQKHYPRHDKFDGKLIKFKNKEQYFSTDFNDRFNFKLWIDRTDKATVRAYSKHLLEQRKCRKGIKWAPSQVELRTILLPPIQTYNQLFGDYYELCREVGLETKFKSKGFLKGGYSQVTTVPPYTILVDSREQKPLEFENRNTRVEGLKFGDYAAEPDDFTCKCHIERKSAPDFVGTFSGGFDRFCRELDRAVAANAYIVVLIEETLSRCLRFDSLPNVYHKKTKATPEFIFRNVRDIIQKYPNVQFLFVDGRKEATNIVTKIFDSECSYKNYDLQYLYDIGQL